MNARRTRDDNAQSSLYAPLREILAGARRAPPHGDVEERRRREGKRGATSGSARKQARLFRFGTRSEIYKSGRKLISSSCPRTIFINRVFPAALFRKKRPRVSRSGRFISPFAPSVYHRGTREITTGRIINDIFIGYAGRIRLNGRDVRNFFSFFKTI